jgi:hypothetical protein
VTLTHHKLLLAALCLSPTTRTYSERAPPLDNPTHSSHRNKHPMAGSMRAALRGLTSASVHSPPTAVAARPLLGLVCPLRLIGQTGLHATVGPSPSNLPTWYSRVSQGGAARRRRLKCRGRGGGVHLRQAHVQRCPTRCAELPCAGCGHSQVDREATHLPQHPPPRRRASSASTCRAPG